MKICPSCGREFGDEMRYCVVCGSALVFPEPEPVPERKGGGIGIIITLVISILIIAAVILACIVISNKKIQAAYEEGYTAATEAAYERQCYESYYLYQFARKIGYDNAAYDYSVKYGAEAEKPAETDAIEWVSSQSSGMSRQEVIDSGRKLLTRYASYIK